VPHVTLKSIANNEPPAPETLYDQPLADRGNTASAALHRGGGAAPAVKSVEDLETSQPQLRMFPSPVPGETLRQGEWRDELRAGIRGKAGQYIRFARLEPLPGLPGLRRLHADGETRPSDEGAASVREKGTAYAPQRIVVSFGPEHAPLEQRQVAQAIERRRRWCLARLSSPPSSSTRSRQRHRRDALARRDAAQGADER
jgi:adenine-specific DNA-methyltransferase